MAQETAQRAAAAQATTATAPVARRPRGRRTQILAVAAEQFHRRGYHQVAMAEVAAAVGITAPALYRHYRSKPELLREAVRGGLAELSGAVERAAAAAAAAAGHPAAGHPAASRPAAGPVALAEALAGVAVDQRALGTLWQRDARLLPSSQRAELRRVLRADVRAAARLLTAARPELSQEIAELLVWSALSVGGSLSYHTFAPPRRRFERLLAELLRAVFAIPIDGQSEILLVRPIGPDGGQLGRREELLGAAVRLFHERGFDNVSTDRLGAAVGIAGPSLYKHFPAKADLLAAALVRCRERLWHEVGSALTDAGSPLSPGPAAALDRGLAAYLDFARRHHHYLGVMVSETDRLAEPDRKAALDFRRDFLRIWVGLLRQVRPEYDSAEARIRVHAMFALVNDGVRHRPSSAANAAAKANATAGAGADELELVLCLHRLARAVLGLREDAKGRAPAGPAPESASTSTQPAVGT